MGDEVELPFAMATSVGPLPFDEVAPAVEFALRAHDRFPTVPVLSGADHSLLAQAVAGLDGVEAVPPGLLRLSHPHSLAVPDEAAAAGSLLDRPCFTPLHSTFEALAAAGHDGPVRVPLTGPVTLALALRAAGVPSSRATAIAGPLVAARSVALLESLRSRLPGAVAVVVLDEPGLIGAMHPTFPLTRSGVRDLLDPVVDALDRSPAAGGVGGSRLLIGVHVPGRTDWETVLGSGVSLLSAPAHEALAGWADPIGRVLAAGGWVAWGAVPVDQPLGTGEELLWRRLAAVWAEFTALGVDPLLLRLRSMVSPADGLAHFGPTQAGRVIDLTTALSAKVRRQTVAARLSLGA